MWICPEIYSSDLESLRLQIRNEPRLWIRDHILFKIWDIIIHSRPYTNSALVITASKVSIWMLRGQGDVSVANLLTRINFYPNINKQLHPLWCVGWNYLSIPQLQRWNLWSLGKDMQFHPTLYRACNHLSMLGSKWNNVSKRGPGSFQLFINREQR